MNTRSTRLLGSSSTSQGYTDTGRCMPAKLRLTMKMLDGETSEVASTASSVNAVSSSQENTLSVSPTSSRTSVGLCVSASDKTFSSKSSSQASKSGASSQATSPHTDRFIAEAEPTQALAGTRPARKSKPTAKALDLAKSSSRLSIVFSRAETDEQQNQTGRARHKNDNTHSTTSQTMLEGEEASSTSANIAASEGMPYSYSNDQVSQAESPEAMTRKRKRRSSSKKLRLDDLEHASNSQPRTADSSQRTLLDSNTISTEQKSSAQTIPKHAVEKTPAQILEHDHHVGEDPASSRRADRTQASQSIIADNPKIDSTHPMPLSNAYSPSRLRRVQHKPNSNTDIPSTDAQLTSLNVTKRRPRVSNSKAQSTKAPTQAKQAESGNSADAFQGYNAEGGATSSRPIRSTRSKKSFAELFYLSDSDTECEEGSNPSPELEEQQTEYKVKSPLSSGDSIESAISGVSLLSSTDHNARLVSPSVVLKSGRPKEASSVRSECDLSCLDPADLFHALAEICADEQGEPETDEALQDRLSAYCLCPGTGKEEVDRKDRNLNLRLKVGKKSVNAEKRRGKMRT